MTAGARLSCAGALVFGLILGCQASLSANASGNGASADADADVHGEGEGQGEMTRPIPASSRALAATPSSPGPSRVLLGARHDLKLSAGKGTASCSCLAVALGGARSGGMSWSAVPPELDEGTQLTIALSSEGQACKGEPKDSLGASYWGYRISGNDIVVLVEAARGGRPLTSGAIIPKPVGPGQVYVAPAFRKSPYGRPLAGTGLCKIGNPGQIRNAPFSELEVGENPAEGAGNGRGQGDRRERAISDQSPDETPTTIELPGN